MTPSPRSTPRQTGSGQGVDSRPPEPHRVTLSNAIHSTRLALREAGITEAPLEAELLVRQVTNLDRAALYATPDRQITEAELQELQAFVARRRQREPLPYILGQWEFYGLDFLVSTAVLIPRPETETLVEEALRWAESFRQGEQDTRQLRIADVGTGSGCVAIALAAHLPQATLVAIDISSDALAVAGQNVARHNVQSRVRLVECDLLSGVKDEVDLIVANLPYIPDVEVPSLQPEVARYEPSVALSGGPDGLSLIRRLLKGASGLLSPTGAIMLEFNPPQRDALVSEARRIWPAANSRVVQDLAGLDRVLVIDLEGRPLA